MAKKTCKGLTYAPYAAGGDGTAVTYSAGKAKLGVDFAGGFAVYYRR